VPARPRLHDEDGTTSCAAQLLRNVIILTKTITPSLTEACEQANGTENRPDQQTAQCRPYATARKE